MSKKQLHDPLLGTTIGGAGSSSRNNKGPGWWKSLSSDDECPITLEPLSSLPHPPFELYSTGGAGSSISYYFDGYALASYIVSRAIFQNPLTRQALTMDDCRLLDDYLDQYCTSRQESDGGSPTTSRMVRVAEAFGLHQMVHVSSTTITSYPGQQSHMVQEEMNRIRRAEVLRSEATSALAGLFVFSSQRNTTTSRRNFAPSSRSREANNKPVPEFGFDLHREAPDMNAAVDEMEGLRVIDDDEVVVVASEAQAYQQAQALFPPLTEAAAAARSSAPAPDVKLLESLKMTAALAQQEEAHRQSRLQAGKQRLSMEATKRQQERIQERGQQKRLFLQEREARKRGEEQRQRAREELEHWRNEQWEQLRLLTEAQQVRMKAATKPAPIPQIEDTALDLVAKEEREKQEEEDKIARQKVKAAEKRKRAKERKQAKKAEELKEAKEKERKAALKKQKEESASKCAACGDGILDCGFEKNGSKFCSPKCARAGPA
jgi:hypothetical protein